LKPVSWIVEKFESKKLDNDTQNNKKSIFREANYLSLDSSKAKKRLGWKAKVDINQALEWTKEWYDKFNQQENMKEFSIKQIETYQSMD